MAKLAKLFISAILVLLIIGTLSTTSASLVARQGKTSDSAPPTDAAGAGATPAVPSPSGATDTGKGVPSLPIPVDTSGTPSPTPSGAPGAGASGAPSGAPGAPGAIPQASTVIASLSAKYASGAPTAPPTPSGTAPTTAKTPAAAPNAGHKVENSLFGIIIAGIVCLFF